MRTIRIRIRIRRRRRRRRRMIIVPVLLLITPPNQRECNSKNPSIPTSRNNSLMPPHGRELTLEGVLDNSTNNTATTMDNNNNTCSFCTTVLLLLRSCWDDEMFFIVVCWIIDTIVVTGGKWLFRKKNNYNSFMVWRMSVLLFLSYPIGEVDCCPWSICSVSSRYLCKPKISDVCF